MNDPTPHHSDTTRHPVEVLAEEFADRMRRGEQPSIDEYVSRFPQYADVLRSVLEPIEAVERVSSQQAAQNAVHSMRTPKQLGDFRIVRELGRGGMGIVYEAVQKSLNRRVALKVINALISDSLQNQTRFQREAEAVAGLHHTNIVQVYGSGQDQGVHYYAMQLIDGVPLDQLIDCLVHRSQSTVSLDTDRFTSAHAVRLLLSSSKARIAAPPLSQTGEPRGQSGVSDGTLPLGAEVTEPIGAPAPSVSSPAIDYTLSREYFRNVARLIADVANALDYAHRQKVLHRDIKPANLILDRDSIVWITDFGLARRVDTDIATRTGEVLGTLRYMAPEQLAGKGDHRIDIYSLGLCLFELLALRPAFETPKQRLLDPKVYSAIPRLRSLNTSIPRDLETIVLKACALEPNDRYSTASAFEVDLRRFLEDRPILARKVTRWESLVRWSRRNPAIASLVALSASMLLTIAGILAYTNQIQKASLTEIGELYEEAEQNLIEKTRALENEQREKGRAEGNLQLAMEAFDQIIANISARGSTIATDIESDGDDSFEVSEAALSQADVTLLESLLGYFEKLSQQNSKDLRLETASARKRVGDLQFRLGKLPEAEQSYLQALTEFQALSKKVDSAAVEPDLDSFASIHAQAEVYHSLMHTAAMQRKAIPALQYFEQARKLLESNEAYAVSPAGRFDLARLLNSVGTLASRMQMQGRPRMFGPPGGGPPGFRPPNGEGPPPPGPVGELRQRKEGELNREALQLLEGLVKEDAENTAYRLALAHALRDEVRLERQRGDRVAADKALEQSIAILEKLVQDNPNSNKFLYELAETLVLVGPFRSMETYLPRALEISEKLISENPSNPAYLSLKAMALVRMSEANRLGPQDAGRNKRSQEWLEQALAIQQGLVDRYDDVPIYVGNLVDILVRLSELESSQEKSKEYRDRAVELVRARNPRLTPRDIQQMVDRLRERRQNMEMRPRPGQGPGPGPPPY
ncbi:protein kinase domain-containing protein [Pirellulaceae bacterium SH501]